MKKNTIYLLAIIIATLAFTQCSDNPDELIQAYNIDFNWGPGGDHGFAKPGLWADADPEEHIQWYEDFGCNVVQTFAVSCNGYAWYKNGFVPEQPGLKTDFLPEMVRLGHERGMKIFGYFCAGANNRWEELHPDLCYQMNGQQIPFTTQYLDYLCASIEDAVLKTGIDGFMLDWLYNPGGGREPMPPLRWIDCEQEMFVELMGESFPGKEKITKEIELKFRRMSINRAWTRIRETAKKANPDCFIWLTSYELKSPEYKGLSLLKEADWVMNEAGDVSRTESVNNLVGANTKLITCLANWNKQDPLKVVEHAKANNIGLYGFTKPVSGNMMKPIDYYLRNSIDKLENDERNIAVLIRLYNGLPMDYVKN
ncbi:hypothetical protein N9164_12880 [Draconibacterium sp.]|nr:hypothetical protein [Draconibacterium sp.]